MMIPNPSRLTTTIRKMMRSGRREAEDSGLTPSPGLRPSSPRGRGSARLAVLGQHAVDHFAAVSFATVVQLAERLLECRDAGVLVDHAAVERVLRVGDA